MKYPKFINEEEYLSLHEGQSELELLKKFSSNLKLIHRLTTKNYTDLNLLIKEYLEVGVKIFSMEIGIVSKIDGEEYTICDVISPGDTLISGDKFELQGTYCREVIRSNSILGFPHVGKMDEMKSHPVYQNMKLESYLSAPIYKNNIIFGTLNFSSTSIRENGFSEYEKELISMLASSIGSFLVLKDKEEKLENAYKRIRKLTGYVAHDLRTPLGSIISIVDIFPDLDEDEKFEMLEELKKAASSGLEIVHSILEVSIVGDGKVSLDRDSFILSDIVNESIKENERRFKAASLSFVKSFDSSLVLVDKERIMQVFANLISNSLKYSKENSVVTISIKNDKGLTTFEIQNQVDEKKVSFSPRGVTESSSIGFGIEIISEILSLHSSELKIRKNEDIYIASFSLPIHHNK
ncbi:GAF domain-containing sensor histidine kinase [Halobacteriovorax sp. HLS]|uniref:GAF domain-containing sensor histidine kinase n=1 Tax=Halobacteriovorax sp. HLS TaxID=2234000 RepID=UPI000FD974B5|nr:GAF domain-containing sensor histidine kinase [Halobacteriovorax sp. HLS]